ncbi:hypothetical protein FS749_006385 [Ceratobasidium sp. UAMH 11750]|nr:hypothetical protein FS749_006385 [Ceratobasidium sp. UAMH 11750]
MTERNFAPFTPRFTELKRSLVSPEDEPKLQESWNNLLKHLETRTKEIEQTGPAIIPQVDFPSLSSLNSVEIAEIKRAGCVVIRGVVNEATAVGYRQSLKEYVQANPSVRGYPPEKKQFFELYWSESQLRARSHPNVVAASACLNTLFHASETSAVSLSSTLMYADRFRMREPGVLWTLHSPHIDGGSIERWEDPVFRKCFASILTGDWPEYDPFDLTYRLEGNTDMYKRPNQSSVFRTWQGWLAMSSTAPGEGTIRFFPDLVLLTAYIILRPFFRPVDNNSSNLDPSNWAVDVESSPDFQGVHRELDAYGKEMFRSVQASQESHPHLKVDQTMTSAPKVNPGDMVFWHCDLLHSVETEHKGTEVSSVMYIPAVPLTLPNAEYVARQREAFLAGRPPPDFPQFDGESQFINKGREGHITSAEGRCAMGLKPFDTSTSSLSPAEKEVLVKANAIFGLAT